MPRPTRTFGVGHIALGKFLSSPYICRSCRHLALRQRLATQQPLRHASSERIPFTEKERHKIWAKDTTSSPEDPYDAGSFLERRRKERARAKEAQVLKELEEENVAQRVAPSGLKSRAVKRDAGNGDVPREYVPSETWDGLEHVGHKGHWRDIPPTPEDDFHPFADKSGLKPSRPEHFLAAIHQATVEIITLQQAGKDLNLSTFATSWYPEIQELIAQTKVEILPGEALPKLAYPTEETKGIIIGWFLKKQREQLQKEAESIAAGDEAVNDLSKVSGVDVYKFDGASDRPNENETVNMTADASEDDIYNAAEVEQSIVAEDEKLAERQRREFEVQYGRDQEHRRTIRLAFFYEGIEAPALGVTQPYLDLELNLNEELTYFLFRRITQLTGLRIPDPVLAKAKTLRSIYIYQLQALKPKPKNLAETLATKTDLASLPNVKIMGRRETPVDKEMAVGRWKIIEAELRSRGLPVLGR